MKIKKTILCVDENPQNLSIRKVVLETRGYRVLASSSSSDALAVFQKGGVDLVIADWILAEMDGAQLVERIKALSPQTPAILFSGKVRSYERETCADVFLPKGSDSSMELLEQVRQLLVRRRGPKRAAVAEHHAQRMDVA